MEFDAPCGFEKSVMIGVVVDCLDIVGVNLETVSMACRIRVVQVQKERLDEITTQETTAELETVTSIGTTTGKSEAGAQTSTTMLLVMAATLIVAGCIITLSMWILSRRKKAKIAAVEEAEEIPSPQKMNSEIINPSEFQDRGPLVMQARMKGRIKHALDDDKSFSLKEIQFDPKQNEICLIGSDVEQLVGMSQISLMSGEKSAEPPKQTKKSPFPTMASEIKKAEAAAKEAQRVAENERMIAICAARRRAKDEAARASRLAAEAQQRSKLEEQKSEKKTSEHSKSVANNIKSGGSEREQLRSSSRSVRRTQETQRSTRSQADEREQNRLSNWSSPRYSHGSDRHSLQAITPPVDHNDSRPVALRRKFTRDGRASDALGAKYYAQTASSDSSSRSSRRFSERPQWPEIRAEIRHSTNHY